MFLLLGYEKNVIYSKSVNNPFNNSLLLNQDTEIECDGDNKDEKGDTIQEEKIIHSDLKKLVLSRLDDISKSLKVEKGHETLSDEIVRKVTENIADLIHGEESKITGNEIWDKDEKSWVCRACIHYSESNERPIKLDKYYKNNFGVLSITRQGEDSTKKTRRIEKENRKYHEKSPLHIWCLQKYQKEKDAQKIESHKNEEGAKKLVRNVVFCLQNSWSAHTYRKLNSKDAMIDQDFPTKNDGIQNFFEIREIVYDRLLSTVSEKLKAVKSASFSLDKVTVRMIPYTVLVTYFFYGGKLNIYLNAVHLMKSNQYSGEATAKFVGEELMRTLGLTRNEVANKFVHSCYDGVYASKDERVRGGGCLR